jgi:hypothetical protein
MPGLNTPARTVCHVGMGGLASQVTPGQRLWAQVDQTSKRRVLRGRIHSAGSNPGQDSLPSSILLPHTFPPPSSVVLEVFRKPRPSLASLDEFRFIQL